MELIDLQLLLTHIVAFLIVLWLLRRYAWGPVLKFLQERSQEVKARLDAAQAERSSAERLRREYDGLMAEAQDRSRRVLQEAVSEGEATQARLKQQAEEARRARLERAEEEVRTIEESASETLRKRMIELALRAAEKAIRERLDDPKHRELIARYIDEIGESGGDARAS